MDNGDPPKFWSAWSDVLQSFHRYWQSYGGWGSLLKSPYFHLSLLITALSMGVWTNTEWWELVFEIHPSILGFTIGAFAIVLMFGTDQFGAILSVARDHEQNPLETPFAKMGAAFVHFLLMQCIALLYALIVKGASVTPSLPGFDFLASPQAHEIAGLIGGLLAIYSLMLALATTERLFSTVRFLVKFQKRKNEFEAKQTQASQAQTSPQRSPRSPT